MQHHYINVQKLLEEKFGVVYKAQNKQTKQIVAIKVLNLDTEEDEVIDVQQEINF